MNISVIILAAGFSRRFGQQDKRFTPINGTPMLDHVVHELSDDDILEILVVMRNSDNWSISEENQKCKIIENSDAESGMTTSMEKALTKLSSKCEAFVIALADMPLLTNRHYKDLYQAFHENHIVSRPLILIPRVNGQTGHPRLFSVDLKQYFLDKRQGRSNKEVIKDLAEYVVYYDSEDPAYIMDVDRQIDLLEVEKKIKK